MNREVSEADCAFHSLGEIGIDRADLCEFVECCAHRRWRGLSGCGQSMKREVNA